MAYDVARQTLGEVLVALDTATIKGRPALFGALGEIATLTLALRAGHMLYPTSVREGMTEQEVSKNHDFYGVKDGQKVTPLEVKSSPRHQKHTYDDQITVLYYSDVCREIAQNWPVHERPQLRVLALELARILVQEPNRQLSRYERQFLKLAIAHIDQKLSSAQTDRIQVENNE